ncbi:MAG: TauD/TfdA family dioxygenase [Gammaproteobacteria bacterium]|nr:TauD/TfdA family dioxygenase [Gammaproteobacteria bacterium]
MTITVNPVTSDFVAEVYDIDLSEPMTAQTIEAIKTAFWRYSILVFPDQQLTQDQHVRFAKHFGALDTSVVKTAVADNKLRVPEEIVDVSNLDGDNGVWKEDSRLRGLQLGNRLWHTDSSFKFVPALCSMLYALEIPPIGGHTEFADLRAAYDALDENVKAQIDGLIAEHSLMYSRAKMGYDAWTDEERKAVAPVPQMLVRTLPQTGRKNLYIASHAGHIVGMDDAQAIPLLSELLEHATQRQFTHTHRWRQNDLVMWDNRCALHRGLAFDDLRFRRDMQRATVLDTDNTCVQAGKMVPEVVAATA